MSEERKAAERLALRLLGFLLIAAFLIWVLPEIWDKLSPFIIAIPLAAALQPVIRFLEKKLKLRRSAASLVPVLLLLCIGLGLLTWLLTIGFGQVSRFVNNSGDLVTESINTVRTALNNLITSISDSTGPGVELWLRGALADAIDRLTTWGTDFAEDMVTFIVNTAASMPYGVIYLSFLTIGLFFTAKNYDEIRSYLPAGQRRRQDSRTTQLTNSTLKSLFGYLRVQGTFGAMVWIVSWIYLTAIGFPYAALTALLCGIMELVPMIGSGVPYIAMSIIQFLLGNSRFGILLLVLTLVLQTVRRILEPKFMSNSMKITPLQSLVGMFVGLAFKGGLFSATVRDFHIISSYLKNRLK